MQVEVEIGEDQLVLDELPDDAGHLVAVEVDDRVCDFDLGHGTCLASGEPRRAAHWNSAPIATHSLMRKQGSPIRYGVRHTQSRFGSWTSPSLIYLWRSFSTSPEARIGIKGGATMRSQRSKAAISSSTTRPAAASSIRLSSACTAFPNIGRRGRR